MRQTIQAESLSIELPAIYKHEFDSEVYEFYDQPSEPLFLEYRSKNGRKVKAKSIADFFVISDDFIGWEEWKPLERVVQLAEEMPGRFVFDEKSGRYISPPAEDYAARFGLGFRVMTSQDISYRLTENFQYLKDFLYTEPEKYFESNESKIFGDCRWVFLSDVLEAGSVNPDDIFHWILNQDVFVDLEKDLLRQPRYCRIFRTQTDSLLLEDVKSVSRHTEPRLGGRVNFCGNVYRISSIKPQFYLLEDEACGIKSVPKKLLDDQLASGTAFLYVEDQGAVFNLLQKAGPRELEQANHRLKILDEIKGGKPIGEVAKSHSISERTIRNWLRQFNLSEHELGEGFVGLIPKISSRGNRESRLDPATRSLIELTLEEHYLNKKSPPLSHAYGLFLHACEKSGIPTVSFKTFSSFAKSIDTAKKVRARSGDKAAYQHESGSNKGRKMPWDLSGQFAMDVVHTDHTQLDIELVSSKNGTGLGRPWLTLFLDGFSRKPVGFAILYDPPSYRSLMIGIRQMVKATGYFPASFVVDGGKEFQGIYFETLVASKGSSIQKRQGNPRQGALIERYFGSVTSQLIDRLQGNTQPTKNVRQMSRDMNPKRNAIWTLESLHAALDSFFELYSTSDHPALGCSPEYQFERSLARDGARTIRKVEYNSDFTILTCPPPRRGEVVADPCRGIRVNFLDYWHPAFRSFGSRKEKVPVRYDPFDIGYVYAFVKGSWLKCQAISHYETFHGRTERELHCLLEERRKTSASVNASRNVTMHRIASWFNDIHETEKRLESGQFAKDQEQKKTVIDIPQPAKESIPVTPCGDSLHQASCEARPKFEVDFSAPIPEDF
jgi:hypothetical protein|tara:strand:+ start:2546 stop:5053 length:2508 start_codon:yes stop_codon:yes gene_type:complete